MAHHKSSKKRIKTSEKRNLYNRSMKSRIKTYIRHFSELLEKAAEDVANLAQYKDEAETKFRKVVSELHKAVSKGVLQRSTAGRKISRLSAHLGKLFNA